MRILNLMVLSLGMAGLASGAAAESTIKTVSVDASNSIHVFVAGADPASPDAMVSVADVREGPEWHGGTASGYRVSVRRLGAALIVVLAEDGLDSGQLYVFSPANGGYRALSPGPIPDRQAGIEADFDSALKMSVDDRGFSDSDFLSALLGFAAAHPGQTLHAFELRVEIGRVRQANIAIPAPDSPPPLFGMGIR